MALSKGFESLAQQLQEASAMMHGDVRKRLSDAVDAAHKGSGAYAYYLDHSGSGKSGKVVYAKNGDTMMAPYSLGDTESGQSAKVDVKNEKKVVPTVTYADPDGDDDAGTKEAEARREAERAKAEDIRLIESVAVADLIRFQEAAGGAINPLVKIISAGRGSTGYYTEALLKRDGPEIFKRGTLMYVNHATAAEEAARPEGDYTKLAAVTTGDAYWDANGKDGPALYAPSKVFAGVSAEVAEKAPYTGVSIRAAGLYAEAKTGEPKRGIPAHESKLAPDGKPGLIGKLTRADSIDLVTKAGRDGKLLLESANPQTGEEPMTEAERLIVTKLQESLAESKLTERRFRERFALQDAAGVVAAYFTTVNVAEGLRKRVTERILSGTVPFTDAGDLDKEKLTKIVEAETKDEAAYISSLSGGKIVTGMGTTQATELTEAQKTEASKLRESDVNRSASGYGLKTAAGKRIFLEGRAAFDPEFNSADKEEVA